MSKDLLLSLLSYDLRDLIPEVFKLETWFKAFPTDPLDAFKVSVENIIEDFSKRMFYEEAVHEFAELLRPEDYLKLHQAFQQHFDPEHLLKYMTLPPKARLLRDKIVLCHDRLADHLFSSLRKMGVKVHKVHKALEEAKEHGIVSKSDYRLLTEFNKLRGQVHHGTHLSYYSGKSLEELECEIKNAERVIKQIIDKGKAESGILKDLARCLEEPLPLSDLILSSLIE